MADRLLRIRAVVDKTGSNTTDIYAGMKAGTFPKSVPIGRRTVGWVEKEIDQWIADRIKARDCGENRRIAGPDGHDKDHGARGYYPYPTMAAERAVDFPMDSILSPNSSVWLWITNFHLLRGDHLIIAKAWGLKPVTLLTWVKRKWGQGQRARSTTLSIP